MHVELEVNYAVRWESEPCPNATRPLHHLVHSPWREGVAKNESGLGRTQATIETLAFECSSSTCSATVFVRLKPPVLSDEHIRLLTDRELLNQRTEEAMGSEPARYEGHKKPCPVEVLSDLRSYLTNSFQREKARLIKGDNKRFALRFGIDGEPCKDLLSFLGFEYRVRRLFSPIRGTIG
jgi:ubiquitin carboxyl-terminal hydrolase 25